MQKKTIYDIKKQHIRVMDHNLRDSHKV